jgi:hypothetical protein
MEKMEKMEKQAEKTSISLFPEQKQIVTEFAEEDRRSFSNALQVIIEEWARTRKARKAAAAQPVEQPA